MHIALVIIISFIIGQIVTHSISLSVGVLVLILLLPLLSKNQFLVFWIAVLSYSLWPYIQYYLPVYVPIGTMFIMLFATSYIVILIRMMVDKKLSYRISLIDLSCIFFILIGIVLFFMADNKSLALIGFKLNVKMFFLILFIRAAKPSVKDVSIFLDFVLIAAFVLSLYGIYQYFFDYYSLINKFGGVLDINERYFGLADSLMGHSGARRAYSLFLNSFTLAYFLMISLFILAGRALIRKNKKYTRMCLIFFPVIFLCLILTFSRAAWLGSIMGCAVIFILNRRSLRSKSILIVVLVVICCLALLAFLPTEYRILLKERLTSIFSSEEIAGAGHYGTLIKDVKTTMQYPLGMGLGKTANYNDRFWAESSFFAIVLEMSIFLGIAYLAIFFSVIFKGIKLFKQISNTSKKEIILVSVSSAVAYLVTGIVFPVWLMWFPTMIAFALMAIILNWAEDENRAIHNHSQL